MKSRIFFTALLLSSLFLLFKHGNAYAVCTTGTPVFVNEFHYDNTGGDVGEFIEIAGPVGTDVAGWSLVLYNGSTNQVYDTINLSGSFADQQGGMGTLAFDGPSNGIQNGAPDGFALVDDIGTVIQFLSYEGTFTASGGPANGMTSTDVGVDEQPAPAAGQSLQLQGTGECYEDFTWAGPIPNTQNEPNDSQTAVTLEYFTVIGNTDGTVTVDWETSQEVDHAGFNILRRAANSREAWTQVNEQLIASTGTNAQGAVYAFTDDSVTAGTWEYLLEDVETDGDRFQHTDFIATVTTQAPTSISLADQATTTNYSLLLALFTLMVVSGVVITSKR